MCWLRKVTYRKSFIKPPLPPSSFSEEESRQAPLPLSIKPPLSLPFILIRHKQLTWMEIHIVFGFRPHDLRPRETLLPLIHLAKLNKPFSLPFSPPLSIKPPSKVLEKSALAPVGLNR